MKTMFRPMVLVAAAALAAMLGACSLTPAYQQPEVALPAAWQDAPAADAPAIEIQWWRAYGSAELDALMKAALAANHDLGAALARIEQARAAARIARSALLPGAGLSASASHDRRERDGQTSRSEDGQALLAVNYEVDLWGGNAAGAKAAQADLAASIYDRASLELVLQSEVAATYFQVLALKDRVAIAQRNVEVAQQLMHLVQARFNAGAATALDLAQQRTALLASQAEIPALELSLKQTRHALAVLLGQAPQGFVVAGESLAALQLPVVAAGEPAELLSRRPDIRAAEARLIAADADIGAARAALYPSLDLSASAGVAGLIGGGATSLASVAGSLAQTLFDGGSLRAGVRFSEAARQELVEDYAQTVLISLQEVADSLAGLNANAQRAELLRHTAEQAAEALRLAQARYRAGAEDLLTVLDTQRSKLSADDGLVQAQLARYTAGVNLVKALGGNGRPAARSGLRKP
ncbi:MAG: efflux transporter outer membrane subunit [Pseudomonadota bacterium]|jgi:outer membrane protein, multidrug efflux system